LQIYPPEESPYHPIPKTGKPKNKTQKKWHVFSARKPPAKTPHHTTQEPQTHHVLPARKTHKSKEPPAKSTKNPLFGLENFFAKCSKTPSPFSGSVE
jgi:hypothetical protein